MGISRLINKNSGQVTAEYLLLAVVLIVFFQLITKTLRENDSLKGFQDVPISILVNVIENGNMIVDSKQSQNLHPNHHDQHYTPDP